MKCRQIVFTKPFMVEYIDTEIPELNDNDVLVETMVSTISCGTERANLMDMPNVLGDFPRMTGYNCSGIVVKKGKAVKSVEIGDRVVIWWSLHKKYNVISEDRVVKIDDNNISHKTGAMSFIATFPMAAVRKTRLEIGESAMVMGLGILGMTAVKLLRASGAVPIIAADLNPKRREIAILCGADYAFDPFDEDFAEKVKNVTNGGVNTAIEVTGVDSGLDEVLDCMAKFGRVALLGCTRKSNIAIDYYRKVHLPGITLVGAHTNARPTMESHPGYFTHNDDIRAVLKLVSGKRLCLEDIVEETHSPEECVEVYDRLMHDKNFPVVVQFDWSEVK